MSHSEDDRKQVLVVDDDSDILELLCTLLRDNGYTAIGAHDANSAVAWVRENVPDLLLIDYMLPETDGMAILRRCLAEGASANKCC
jgi:DNA-binding response OmpR family regulator